jgi:hypothetical protein
MEDLEEGEEEQNSATPWSPTVVDVEERQDSTAPGPGSRTSRLVKSFRGYGLSLTVQEMVR